jgi:hypothetical protein
MCSRIAYGLTPSIAGFSPASGAAARASPASTIIPIGRSA